MYALTNNKLCCAAIDSFGGFISANSSVDLCLKSEVTHFFFLNIWTLSLSALWRCVRRS